VLARNNYSAAESIRRLTDLIETCGAKSDVQFPVGMTPASGSFDLNSSALNVQYSNLPVKSKKYHAAVLIDNLLNRIMSTFSGSRV
jgi:hypothetical protein